MNRECLIGSFCLISAFLIYNFSPENIRLGMFLNLIAFPLFVVSLYKLWSKK